MATIDNKAIIDKLIAGNGVYTEENDDPDYPYPDPAAVKIIEYTNREGRTTWGVVFETERRESHDRYEEETEYVRNPRVIWRRKVG